MEHYSNTSGPVTVYRISWVAYLITVVFMLFLITIGASIAYAFGELVGYLGLAVGFLILGYRLALLRSFQLYCDEHGVWVYRGILPWSKGVNGVKWRDLEDASYETNFFSWALIAYRVRIGHRFTKTSEIIVPYIHRGHEAVIHINEQHRLIMGNS